MRFVAAAVLIFSCSMMGLLTSASYRHRVQTLRQLVNFIHNLNSEINYTYTTLPEIIAGQIPHFTGVVQQFLTILDTGLNDGSGQLFFSVWEQGLVHLKANGVPFAVIEDLKKTGLSLGSSDVIEQDKSLQLLTSRLEKSIELALAEQEKQTKLWPFLGFSAGVFIVLLLF